MSSSFYNIDEIVSVESYGFTDSHFHYVPRKEIKTWYGSIRFLEERITSDYSYAPYTLDEFLEMYPNYVIGKDKKILRKPRIELRFTNKDGISITYDTVAKMQDTLDSIIEKMKNVLEHNNH